MLFLPGHPDRSTPLNNLALHLGIRHKLLGGVEDFDEAILLDREALSLRPPGHPNRTSSLSNLCYSWSPIRLARESERPG